MRWVLLCGLMGAVAVSAQEKDKPADPISEKLASAKKAYTESLDKSRAGLLATMKQREDAAKAAGDLKALEAIRDEVRAFEIAGALPKTIPTRTYESEKRLAAGRLEEAFAAARKAYTQADRIPEAKAVDRELAEFKDGKGVGPGDGQEKDKEWVAGTVWTGIYIQKLPGDNLSRDLKITITKRDGKSFQGQFEIGFTSGAMILEMDGLIDAAGRCEFKFTKIAKAPDVLRKGSTGQNIVGLRAAVFVDGKVAIGRYLHGFAEKPTAPPRVITFEVKLKP